MKKIKCTLGTLNRAIEEIEEYQKDLDRKVKLLMERLAEIGIDKATVSFGEALYAGTNDVKVGESPIWISDNQLVISAVGNAVTFIEFGTGVHYASQGHPKAADFGYTRGGYGHHLGKLDSWRYSGDPGNMGTEITDGKHKGEVETHGNPANRCLYEAAKEMREQIKAIAEEVFGND